MVAVEEILAHSLRSMLGTTVMLSRICASLMESVAETFSLMRFSFWLLLGPGDGRSILQWFWKRDNVQAQSGRYCGSIRRSRGAIASYSSSQLRGKKRRQQLVYFLCQAVLFCFALSIPAGAFLTMASHLSNAAFKFTSPFIKLDFFHLILGGPGSSLCKATPRSSASRPARSILRSMLVRKLKS